MNAEGSRSEHDRFSKAEKVIGHRFADRDLLRRALTHPSAHEGASSELDYERLEFLGDAVLGMIVVEQIFDRFPELGEGEMTKRKIAVVSGDTLARAAEGLGLSDLILVGKSEHGAGERGRRSALENVYEALVGALYLDGGLDAARSFVVATLAEGIDGGSESLGALDHPKSALQERVQARGQVPVYRIVAEEGPPHDRRFVAEVVISGIVAGTGEGASKKEAEMRAAAEALSLFSES